MNTDPEEKIHPRVSREERLRYRREGCRNCGQEASLRRPNVLSLFLLFMVVFVSFVFLRKASSRSKSSQTMEIGAQRFLSWEIVDEQERQGLSIVLENNSAEDWDVERVIVFAQNTVHTNKREQTISPSTVEAFFFALPLEGTQYRLVVEPL